MKYAVISDIHGNYHAFEAVLEDAKAQGVDIYVPAARRLRQQLPIWK